MEEEFKQREKYDRKIKITGGLWDAYRFYKSIHPESKISRTEYVNICQSFNKRISHEIITKSIEFRCFYRLGFFGIRSYKRNIVFKNGKININKNPIDWVKTKELWAEMYPGKDKEQLSEIPNKKLVIHTNEHTNGYVYRWSWDKTLCNIPNNRIYSFKTVKGGITPDGFRYGRKGLSSWIISGDRDNEYLDKQYKYNYKE